MKSWSEKHTSKETLSIFISALSYLIRSFISLFIPYLGGPLRAVSRLTDAIHGAAVCFKGTLDRVRLVRRTRRQPRETFCLFLIPNFLGRLWPVLHGANGARPRGIPPRLLLAVFEFVFGWKNVLFFFILYMHVYYSIYLCFGVSR